MKEQVYEQLTLFPEASHVSRSVWLESRKEKGTTVISGLRCEGLSPSLSHVGWWVKTYLESCELLLPTSSRIWKGWAFTSSCLILKLRVSVPRTTGSELGLWPTVTTRDWKDGDAKTCRNVPVNCLLGRAIHRMNGGPGDADGQLNPTWVEWLMGFPIGWTELKD